MSFDAIEARLVEAWDMFEMMVPGDSEGSPFAADGPWWRIVPDFADRVAANELDPGAAAEALRAMVARRRNLSAAEVSRMNETLAWLDVVPARGELRRIVGAVLRQKARGGSQVEWARIARSIGSASSPNVLRMSYSRAMQTVVQSVNARLIQEFQPPDGVNPQ